MSVDKNYCKFIHCLNTGPFPGLTIRTRFQASPGNSDSANRPGYEAGFFAEAWNRVPTRQHLYRTRLHSSTSGKSLLSSVGFRKRMTSRCLPASHVSFAPIVHSDLSDDLMFVSRSCLVFSIIPRLIQPRRCHCICSEKMF